MLFTWLQRDSNNHLVRKRTHNHLNDCGFKSRCSHLNFRFCACFEQGVPWHSGNNRVWIHSETRTWHDNIQLKGLVLNCVYGTLEYLSKCIVVFLKLLEALQTLVKISLPVNSIRVENPYKTQRNLYMIALVKWRS